jgi:hypothetical protein
MIFKRPRSNEHSAYVWGHESYGNTVRGTRHCTMNAWQYRPTHYGHPAVVRQESPECKQFAEGFVEIRAASDLV